MDTNYNETLDYKTLEEVDLSLPIGIYRVNLDGNIATYAIFWYPEEYVKREAYLVFETHTLRNKFYNNRWHGWE